MQPLQEKGAFLPPHLRVFQALPSGEIPSSQDGLTLSMTPGGPTPDIVKLARPTLHATTQDRYPPTMHQAHPLPAATAANPGTTQQWKAALQAHLQRYQAAYAPSQMRVPHTDSALSSELQPTSTTRSTIDAGKVPLAIMSGAADEDMKIDVFQPTTSTMKLTRAHLEAFERMTVTTSFAVSSLSSGSTTHEPVLDKGKAKESLLPLLKASPKKSDTRTGSQMINLRKGDVAVRTKNKITTDAAKMSKKYPCSYDNCLLGFDTAKALIRHKTERHDHCKKCTMDFKNFQDHLDHKIESSEHITCPVCGEDFRSSGGRDMHILTMHPNPQDLNCPGCSAKFIRAGSLIDHIEKNKCISISVQQFERYRAVNALRDAHLSALEGDEEDDVDAPFIGSEATDTVGGVEIPFEKEEDYVVSFPSLAPAAKKTGNEPNTIGRPPLAVGVDTTANVSTLHSGKSLYPEASDRKGASGRKSDDPLVLPKEQEKTSAWTNSASASKKLFPKSQKQEMQQAVDPNGQGAPRYSHQALADMVTGSASFSPGLCFANGEPVEAINPQSPHFNPEAFRDVLGRYKCPYPRCGKFFPVRANFVAHLNSSTHKGIAHRCPECLRIYKDATALTQHMETTTSRCKIKDTKNYAKIMGLVSGGIISVEGQYVDGTVRYEVAEPEW
ncbi:hypothetical protein MMC13_007566 [Lambiella insularis]|nr:hypothetical protein [Lambiella insularis]